MNRLCKLFVIITAACTAAGCFSPIGGGIDGQGTPDRFWAVPDRVAYKVNERFMPKSDVRLFASYQGVVESVPVEKAKISIAEDPDKPDTWEDIEEYCFLYTKGTKIIVAEYSGMSDSYFIEVLDAAPEKGDGAGVIIDWGE